MNWEAIGAVGEILGAIAVVFTLIYLAIQVRYTKNLVINQNHQTSYEQIANTLTPQATSPQVAALVVKGNQSYLSLNKEERAQFEALLVLALNSVEAPYRLANEPREGAAFEMYWQIAKYHLNSPGAHEFWKQHKHTFYEDFAVWIDQKIAAEEDFCKPESSGQEEVTAR